MVPSAGDGDFCGGTTVIANLPKEKNRRHRPTIVLIASIDSTVRFWGWVLLELIIFMTIEEEEPNAA